MNAESGQSLPEQPNRSERPDYYDSEGRAIYIMPSFPKETTAKRLLNKNGDLTAVKDVDVDKTLL